MKLILTSQFANDNILFLKDAVEGFIAKLDNTENAPDEKELSFLKGNASEAAEQARREFQGLLP